MEPPAAAADDGAAPRAGAVHSVEGSLAILEGISGDVKPGTLLDVGGAGATAVLLAHREPKTFALVYSGADGATRARRVWKTRRLRTSNPVTPCVSAKGAVSTCPPSAT